MRQGQAIRTASAVAVTAVIVFGSAPLAGASDAKEVSNRVYARRLCSSLAEVVDAEQSFVSDYSALTKSDPASFHDEATLLANSYLDSSKSARAELKKVQPPGGEKVARLFNAYLRTAVRQVDAIIRRFTTADPTSPGFQDEVAAFEGSLQSLVQELPEPFQKLRDQHLLAALRREVTCAGIVEVG